MLEHLDTDRDNVSLDQGKVLRRTSGNKFTFCTMLTNIRKENRKQIYTVVF